MQLELVRLQHEVGITFVIVTHDQEEALSMADRIAVMDQGKMLQIAPPADLYERPNCRMVADFIGKSNIFRGQIIGRDNGKFQIDAEGLGRVDLPDDGKGDGDIEIAVRPEKIGLTRDPPSDHRLTIPCRVVQHAYFGDKSHVYVETDTGQRIICQSQSGANLSIEPGDSCYLLINPDDCLLLRNDA